jgi:hypothetical protein
MAEAKPNPKKPDCSFCQKVKDLLLGGLNFIKAK